MRLLADCIRRRLVGLPVRITPVACRAASIRQRSCFRMPPRSAVKGSQLVLRRFEVVSLRRVDLVARPVDVEGQHGHCRAERIRPATRATLGGSLQRQGNIAGIGPSEDTRLQVQRVAGPGDVLRPSLSLVGHPAVSPGYRFVARIGGGRLETRHRVQRADTRGSVSAHIRGVLTTNVRNRVSDFRSSQVGRKPPTDAFLNSTAWSCTSWAVAQGANSPHLAVVDPETAE